MVVHKRNTNCAVGGNSLIFIGKVTHSFQIKRVYPVDEDAEIVVVVVDVPVVDESDDAEGVVDNDDDEEEESCPNVVVVSHTPNRVDRAKGCNGIPPSIIWRARYASSNNANDDEAVGTDEGDEDDREGESMERNCNVLT